MYVAIVAITITQNNITKICGSSLIFFGSSPGLAVNNIIKLLSKY
jgi:hypothetical protein